MALVYFVLENRVDNNETVYTYAGKSIAPGEQAGFIIDLDITRAVPAYVSSGVVQLYSDSFHLITPGVAEATTPVVSPDDPHPPLVVVRAEVLAL